MVLQIVRWLAVHGHTDEGRPCDWDDCPGTWCDAPYTNSQKLDVLSKQLVVDVVYSQLVWLVSIYTRLGVVDLIGHCLGQP